MSTDTILAGDGDTLADEMPAPRSNSRPKPTGPQVSEFTFNRDTYMVSPDADHGAALRLTMQGQTMPISVARLLIQDHKISSVEWETPFSGHSPEKQNVLVDLVRANAAALIAEVPA